MKIVPIENISLGIPVYKLLEIVITEFSLNC